MTTLVSAVMAMAFRFMSLIPAAWDVETFLGTAQSKAKTIGAMIIVLAGIICLIIAVVKLVAGIVKAGKPGGQPTNWIVIVCLFVVAGVCLFGGISLFAQISEGLKDTMEGMGSGANAGKGSMSSSDFASTIVPAFNYAKAQVMGFLGK